MNRTVAAAMAFLAMGSLSLVPETASTEPTTQVAQEQRIDLTIRDYQFLLSQPAQLHLGQATVIIVRNEDIVTHGFTSELLAGLLVRGEGKDITAYGKGIEGFYVEPGETLVIRFTLERQGRFRFRCDLHPDMKGELLSLQAGAA